jgi:3-methylcrotonyl-CoA carboxylase beta subunit
VALAGGEEYVARHHERGKLLHASASSASSTPTSFLGAEPAAGGRYEDDVPSAGIVTGVGWSTGARS